MVEKLSSDDEKRTVQKTVSDDHECAADPCMDKCICVCMVSEVQL